MPGMSDEEWARMTGTSVKKKPAKKKDPVLGAVSADAKKNMGDSETIRSKVAKRKAYLDSL